MRKCDSSCSVSRLTHWTHFGGCTKIPRPHGVEPPMKDEIKDTFEALQLLEQGEFQELGDELLPWAFPELRNLKPFGLTREGKTRRGVPDSFVGLTAGEATIAVEYTTQASDTAGKLGSDFRSVRGKSPAADRIFLCTNRAVEEADLTSLRDQARTAGVRLEIVDGARLAAILSRDRQDIRQRFLKIPIGAHTLASLLSTLSETIEIATRGRSSSVSDGRFLRRFRLDVLCFERVRRDPRGTTLLLGEGGEGKTSWSIDYARRFAVVQPTVWLHALDLVDKSVDPLSAAVSLAAYKSADPARLPELAALLLREKQHLLLFLDGADESRDYSYIERALRSFRKSAVGELTHVVLCSRTEAAQQLQDALSVFVPDLNSEQNVLRLGPLRDDERRKLLALLGASEAASRSIENHLSREQAGNPLFIEMALVLERVGNLDRSGPDLIARVADHFVADICGRLRENGRVRGRRASSASSFRSRSSSPRRALPASTKSKRETWRAISPPARTASSRVPCRHPCSAGHEPASRLVTRSSWNTSQSAPFSIAQNASWRWRERRKTPNGSQSASRSRWKRCLSSSRSRNASRSQRASSRHGGRQISRWSISHSTPSMHS